MALHLTPGLPEQYLFFPPSLLFHHFHMPVFVPVSGSAKTCQSRSLCMLNCSEEPPHLLGHHLPTLGPSLLWKFPLQALMAGFQGTGQEKPLQNSRGWHIPPVTLSMGCSAGDKEQTWSREPSRRVPSPWLSSRHPFQFIITSVFSPFLTSLLLLPVTAVLLFACLQIKLGTMLLKKLISWCGATQRCVITERIM